MKPTEVPNEGVRRTPPTQPRIVLPDEKKLTPLVAEKIGTHEGLFTPALKQAVKTIALDAHRRGLSWPIMEGCVIAKLLHINFPNARVVDTTGLVQMVKGYRPDQVTTISQEGVSVASYISKKEGTLVLDMQGNHGLSALDFAELNVGFGNLTRSWDQYVYLHSRFQRGILSLVESNAYTISEIKTAQLELFQSMGLTIPEGVDPIRLRPIEFSDVLNQTIGKLEARIKTAGAEGLPLIAVNVEKRKTGHFTEIDPLLKELAVVARETPGVYYVNTWVSSSPGEHTPQGQLALEAITRNKHPDSKIMDWQLNRLELAAALHLTEKTGGCSINLLGGPALLANWLNTPEILVSLAIPDWNYLMEQRPNNTRINASQLQGTLQPRLQSLIQQ